MIQLANRKSINEKIIPDIQVLENKNQLLIAIDFLTSQSKKTNKTP